MGKDHLSDNQKIVKNGLPYVCGLVGVIVTLGNPLGAVAGATVGTLLGLVIVSGNEKQE
jgi:hypothetical protein